MRLHPVPAHFCEVTATQGIVCVPQFSLNKPYFVFLSHGPHGGGGGGCLCVSLLPLHISEHARLYSPIPLLLRQISGNEMVSRNLHTLNWINKISPQRGYVLSITGRTPLPAFLKPSKLRILAERSGRGNSFMIH